MANVTERWYSERQREISGLVGGPAVVRSFGRQRWQHQIGRNCTVVCRPHLLIFFLSVRRLDVSANCRLRHHAPPPPPPSPSSSSSSLSIRLRTVAHRTAALRPVSPSVGRSQQRVIARPSTAKIIIEHGVAAARWMTMNEPCPPGQSSLYGTTPRRHDDRRTARTS